jgi:hypothetical protein
MRGRVVLLVVLAVATALVAVYVTGWSRSTPTTPAAPSTPSLAPARQGAAKPATTTPKAAAKPAGNAAQPAQQSAAKPAPKPKSQPKPKPSTDPVRFGPVGGAGWDSETSVSVNRRALSTTFADLHVSLGNEDAPDTERSMLLTIPLTGGAAGETLAIHAQGYSIADEHAKAQLVLRARGRTIVQPFPAGSDDEFVTTLELPAVPGATYELSAVIQVQPDGDTGGDAYLTIASIDIEIR